jgi:hypothetical protein
LLKNVQLWNAKLGTICSKEETLQLLEHSQYRNRTSKFIPRYIYIVEERKKEGKTPLDQGSLGETIDNVFAMIPHLSTALK